MPNDDFSIKTGIEVNDSDIQKLKDFSESLTKIYESLDRIGSSKFNTGLTSGLKNVQKETGKAKKEFDELVNTLNKGNKKNVSKGKSLGVEQATKSTFNAIDPEIYARIDESLNHAASAAQKIKEALGGDIQSGLLTQIDEMLAKKDELMNLANILKANKEALKDAAKATGSKKKNPKAIDEGKYKQTADQILSKGTEKLEGQYSSRLLEAKVQRSASGVAKISGYIKNEKDQWQKIQADIDEFGRISNPSIANIDNDKKKNGLQAMLDSMLGIDDGSAEEIKLTTDEMSDYASIIKDKIQETYTEFKDFGVTVGSGGSVSISKQIEDEVGDIQSVAYRFSDATELIGLSAEEFRKTLEEKFSSGSLSISGKDSISKEISDLYNRKSETESEYQRLSSPLVKNTEAENARLQELVKEREKIDAALKTYESEIKNASSDSEIGKSRGDWLRRQEDVKNNFSDKDGSISKVYERLSAAGTKSFTGSSQVFSDLTSKVNSLTDAFNNGKISSKEYVEQTQKLFNGFDKTIAKLDVGSSIDKLKKEATDYLDALMDRENLTKEGEYSVVDKENVSTITAKFKTEDGMLKTIQIQANAANNTVKELSQSLSEVKKKAETKDNSGESSAVEKYTTDKTYKNDLRYLSKTAAESEVNKIFQHKDKTYSYDNNNREEALKRIEGKYGNNTTEKNAYSDYENVMKNVTANATKYRSEILKAFSDIGNLESVKTGIAGIDKVFDSGYEKITKWATALVNGSIDVETFQKRVSGLQGSLGNIYKIIDTSGGVDAGTELRNFIKELAGVENIDFQKLNTKNGIATLSGTFKNASGEAQTLNAQLNTTNGEMRLLSSSVAPLESGISKFFSGWKEKMINLAQYLTSFQAMNQLWNTFKQGTEVVKEFDTALTEMRKVSDEPVGKLKEFQKESFDMAKGVGTTALQIQNSTADFMRLGQSLDSAQQSSVNANRLLNVSEFDNIEDATSALISMKAAYKDLSEEKIIDSLNAVGELLLPKHIEIYGDIIPSK